MQETIFNDTLYKLIMHKIQLDHYPEINILCKMMYYFSFTNFFFHWVFFSKVLTRHILDEYLIGNVINN
jgi:hypothetical protein